PGRAPRRATRGRRRRAVRPRRAPGRLAGRPPVDRSAPARRPRRPPAAPRRAVVARRAARRPRRRRPFAAGRCRALGGGGGDDRAPRFPRARPGSRPGRPRGDDGGRAAPGRGAEDEGARRCGMRRRLSPARTFESSCVLADRAPHGPLLLAVTCVLATVGLAAAGTIYGALAAGLRVRETLLPLLLLPVVAPVLLAATRASEAALGSGSGDGWAWVQLLGVFAVIYV